MSTLSRRRVLAWGCLGTHTLLAGCGGGGASEAQAMPLSAGSEIGPAPSPPKPAGPVAAPAPVAVSGGTVAVAIVAGADRSIDLNETLPAGVPRGGSFSIDSSGAKLPAGVSLSPSGLLSVASTTLVGDTNGVVFNYATP